MAPFDRNLPKNDSNNLFIISMLIFPEIFMTQAYMSHRKVI